MICSTGAPSPMPSHPAGFSSYLSHGVGLGAVGDLGGVRAVRGVGVDDLSDDSLVAPGGGASGSGKNDGSSELHFVGIRSNSKVALRGLGI